MRSATGDTISITHQAIIVHLAGLRDVVSSAAHNGGSRKDLTHLYVTLPKRAYCVGLLL